MLTYQTSTNAVRQDTQSVIKQWWKEIGVDAQLKNVNASVFFGGDPGSPDTFQKFYTDVEDVRQQLHRHRSADLPGAVYLRQGPAARNAMAGREHQPLLQPEV